MMRLMAGVLAVCLFIFLLGFLLQESTEEILVSSLNLVKGKEGLEDFEITLGTLLDNYRNGSLSISRRIALKLRELVKMVVQEWQNLQDLSQGIRKFSQDISEMNLSESLKRNLLEIIEKVPQVHY